MPDSKNVIMYLVNIKNCCCFFFFSLFGVILDAMLEFTAQTISKLHDILVYDQTPHHNENIFIHLKKNLKRKFLMKNNNILLW